MSRKVWWQVEEGYKNGGWCWPYGVHYTLNAALVRAEIQERKGKRVRVVKCEVIA